MANAAALEQKRFRTLNADRRADALGGRVAPLESSRNKPDETDTSAVDNPAGQSRALRRAHRLGDSRLESSTDSSAGQQADSYFSGGGLVGSFTRARHAYRNTKEQTGSSQAAARAAFQQAVAQDLQMVAETAYRSVWGRMQDTLEITGLKLLYIPFITLIPVALFIVRFFIGNMLGRFFTINFRGVELAMVPSMPITELASRGAKNTLLLIILLLWCAIVYILYKGMTQPGAQIQLIWEAVKSFLGS